MSCGRPLGRRRLSRRRHGLKEDGKDERQHERARGAASQQASHPQSLAAARVCRSRPVRASRQSVPVRNRCSESERAKGHRVKAFVGLFQAFGRGNHPCERGGRAPMNRFIRYRLLSIVLLGVLTSALSVVALVQLLTTSTAQRVERARDAVSEEVDRLARSAGRAVGADSIRHPRGARWDLDGGRAARGAARVCAGRREGRRREEPRREWAGDRGDRRG